jgi:hypothetical protein
MVRCSSDKHVVSNPLHANEVLRSRNNGTVSGNHVANPPAYNHSNPIGKDILMIAAEPRGGHPLRLQGKTKAVFLVLALLGGAFLLAQQSQPVPFSAQEFLEPIKYLASDQLQGRGDGTPELDQAAHYLADDFREFGLKPAGDDGTFLQHFTLVVGAKLGTGNSVTFKSSTRSETMKLQEYYVPISFSSNATVNARLVFAGYGITAPEYHTPVLAKHSKSKPFSLIDCVAVGVDRMQRNFDPMRRQLEAWRKCELTDVTAKVAIYEAFVEGKLEAPKHLAHTVHDLYFEPTYDEFKSRTIWSLSNAFTSAFKALEPIPQFRATAKLGEFLETRFSESF